ncbi:MAG: hypothetical protein GDA49_00680 [Rhodospirillales bacterium]|nr:hypothetical protein [Rhodospirillales bacterium]
MRLAQGNGPTHLCLVRIRRYDAQSCELFVYLHPEGVHHVDLQGEGLDDVARSACFEDMVPEVV